MVSTIFRPNSSNSITALNSSKADAASSPSSHLHRFAGARRSEENQTVLWYFTTPLILFPLRASQERQHEQISQNIDDTPGQNNQTKTLCWRKIRQDENGKAGGNDHVRIDDPAPLFFARRHPSGPPFFSVALRATNTKNKMNHRINRNTNADVRSWRRDDIHRYMEPTDTTKHAQRHQSQAHK